MTLGVDEKLSSMLRLSSHIFAASSTAALTTMLGRFIIDNVKAKEFVL